MRVVILARTIMGKGLCIGGMVEDTGKPVRLMPPGYFCQPPHAPFQVGEIWDADLAPRASIDLPHSEDHDATNARRVGQSDNLEPLVRRWAHIWKGGPRSLFEGTLKFRKTGTAFLPREGPQPIRSVGFWELPADLLFLPRDNDRRFLLRHSKPEFRIPYVGSEPPPPYVQAGTIARVSLARWWLNPRLAPEGETCALQMSGWIGPPRRATAAAATPAS